MKAYWYVTTMVLICCVWILVLGLEISAQPSRRAWNFDQDVVGKAPAGFTLALTGRGAAGEWVVLKDASAPSAPNLLAQTSKDKTDFRFPLAIADGTSYKDVELSVKFKAVSGSVDQGAGLVFRLKDKDNYYVVRANALEDNLRLYRVVSGRRVQFAGVNFQVTPQTWHELKVEARGNEFKCYYDGQLRITVKDDTFRDAGKVGLWTKADSEIYFDDLTVVDAGNPGSSSASDKTFAQKLVDDLVARHPGLVRVGLHVTPPNSGRNIIVASNVPEKIGQKSDPEDLKAMRSGQPVVLKEGENLDVTLPLHDSAGKTIGAIGLTLKPSAGEQEAAIVRRAGEMARQMEKDIPSKEKLFTQAR